MFLRSEVPSEGYVSYPRLRMRLTSHLLWVREKHLETSAPWGKVEASVCLKENGVHLKVKQQCRSVSKHQRDFEKQEEENNSNKKKQNQQHRNYLFLTLPSKGHRSTVGIWHRHCNNHFHRRLGKCSAKAAALHCVSHPSVCDTLVCSPRISERSPQLTVTEYNLKLIITHSNLWSHTHVITKSHWLYYILYCM